MKRLVILGGGTAGTTVANKLRAAVPADQLHITVVDADDTHLYQPGFIFVPFGMLKPSQTYQSRHSQINEGIELVLCEIDKVDPVAHEVSLMDGRALSYDHLIVATGVQPRPDQTPGLPEALASGSAQEFYTYEGSVRLAEAFKRWRSGHVVVHICEMPIKCPVAPLEVAFLFDSWLRDKKARGRTRITYVTPLDGAFTKPVASRELGDALKVRDIAVETDFAIERVDDGAIVSYDGREIAYDLLITVPVNMGAEWVARSGMGDEANLVECDQHTMKALHHDDVWVLGDAGTLKTSKAGSVAHFAIDVFVENYLAELAGRPAHASFDGHANCFVESGGGKAMLLDFNYDTEPLTGVFPLPAVGPMSLLKETRLNHLGKLAFRWMYWNLLLPGRPIPLIPAAMSMVGKRVEGEASTRPVRKVAPAPAVASPAPSAPQRRVAGPAAKPATARPSSAPRAKPVPSASAAPAERKHYAPDPRKGVDSTADPASVLDTPIIPKF
jgi:sulfide:quinone oxidoreductase